MGVPMIFVGHSMGGFVARCCLHRHPKNLVGPVLIEPESEFLEQELRKVQTPQEIRTADSTLTTQPLVANPLQNLKTGWSWTPPYRILLFVTVGQRIELLFDLKIC